jgi:hypothetical protein
MKMLRGENSGFFRTLGDSFRFSSYEQLAEEKPAKSVKYFLLVMVVATVLMFLAAIPAFMNFSKNVDAVIDNFNSISIKINASSKGPVIIFPDDKAKEITIDWDSNATELERGKIIIAKDRYVKKTMLGSQYVNLSGFSNVLEHKEAYNNALMLLVIFLIPSMVVGAYVFFGIKFFIIILLASIIGFIISRVLRFSIELKNCFNLAVYAFTIAIFIEMVTFVYNINMPYFRIEWIGYAISIVYLILGIKNSGFMENKHDRKGEIGHRKRYFQIRE